MAIFTLFKNILKKLRSGQDSGRPNSELGRNQLCHCGSGKKYKACHQESDRRSIEIQATNNKLSQLNRNQEPTWGDGLSPEENVAQKGLTHASKKPKK